MATGPRAIGGGPLATVGAVVGIVVVTVYRMIKNAGGRYPGHADPSFYYTVARNIEAGRGARIDYVWQFLTPDQHLVHYAFDYWLPLPSLLMAAGLHFDDSLPAALDVNTALIALTALGTLLVARQLTGSAPLAAAAAAIVVLLPSMSAFAARTESAAALAACATLTIGAALAARQRPWLWPFAGVLAGLASIARNEGLLLVATLLLSVLVWHRGRAALGRLAATAAGALAVLGPVAVLNHRAFGTVLTPASRHFAFIVHYPQLYSLHVDDSPGVLFAGGMRHFVLLRLNTVGDQARVVGIVFGAPVAIGLAAVFGLGAAFALRHARPPTLRSPWLLPVGYLVLLLAFEATVTPVVASAGAIHKSMISVVPVLVVAALAAGRRVPFGPAPRVLAVVAIVAYAASTVPPRISTTLRTGNEVGAHAAALLPALDLEQGCLHRKLVLMTRAPWEISEATGYPTVQIPYGSYAEVMQTARRYHVTDITIPATLAERSAADLSKSGGPLIRVRGTDVYPVYRIRAIGGDRCRRSAQGS